MVGVNPVSMTGDWKDHILPQNWHWNSREPTLSAIHLKNVILLLFLDDVYLLNGASCFGRDRYKFKGERKEQPD